MSDPTKTYLVNLVGTCRNCVIDKNEWWHRCRNCEVMICAKHANVMKTCDLCKYIPNNYNVCIICDCPISDEPDYDEPVDAEETVDDDKSYNDSHGQMGFSESRVSPSTEVNICNNCRKNYITPLVYPNTSDNYLTHLDILDMHASVIGGIVHYDAFRYGNNFNYKLIQDGREQIIKFYKNTIPLFILPEVANIIIDYCGFARDIVFEEYP